MITIDRTLNLDTLLSSLTSVSTEQWRDHQWLEHTLLPQLGLADNLAEDKLLRPFCGFGLKLAHPPKVLANWLAALARQSYVLDSVLFIGGSLPAHALLTALLRRVHPLIRATYLGEPHDEHGRHILQAADIQQLAELQTDQSAALVVLGPQAQLQALMHEWLAQKDHSILIVLDGIQHPDYPASRQLWENLQLVLPARQHFVTPTVGYAALGTVLLAGQQQ